MTRTRTDDAPPVLRLSDAPGGKVRVSVGAKKLADLAPASIIALELRDAMPVSPAVMDAIAQRATFEKTHAAALAAIARRPLSEAALRERLARRTSDTCLIDLVIASLKRDHLVDDEALARRVIEEETARAPAAAPLLEAKLARRGVPQAAARQAASDHLEGAPASALDAARVRAASLPEDLSPPARARRLYAYLARRGFEEHEAADAVERLLGVLPDPLD